MRQPAGSFCSASVKVEPFWATAFPFSLYVKSTGATT
jgi:hypothetical protein